ncbi:juvenile hormone acid O-methyltransferase-like [Arctopsyche grandis]|uniref:juvenile hormone acid O-methyltransferase-like n=1 Tax=Arctopsyche grandis TaxID=121162 RepID=UPI00406D813E
MSDADGTAHHSLDTTLKYPPSIERLYNTKSWFPSDKCTNILRQWIGQFCATVMFNATLYHKANSLQRRDATDVLDKYLHLVQWRKDGKDVVLDVGCGEGDVTINILLKRLPIDFHSLTGGDLSVEMVDYAKNIYATDKINFALMNIVAEPKPEHINKYDHLFSFNCLHWVQDQASALRSMYNMLNDTGDCVITFIAKSSIFDIRKLMSEDPRWEQYMRNHDIYVSPYNNSLNPVAEFRKLLFGAGFKNVKVQIKHKTDDIIGLKNLRDFAAAVDPFLKDIPKHLHEEYLDQYIYYSGELGYFEEDDNNISEKVLIHSNYRSLIAYASKR